MPSAASPPLFSIILPTFNRAYVLWRAIQSVQAQTEARWELLVINDGSTDDTRRLLEEFHDARIRVFATVNRGASAARNFGVCQAHAAYIAYLDSDNTWHPNFLETMLQAVHLRPDGVLWYCGQYTSVWQRSATGDWTLEYRLADPRAQYTIAEALQLEGADTNCIVHTRDLLDAIGGWDEACSFLEDWDLFARCIMKYPARVWWVPHMLVEYRQVYGPDVDGLCATTVQDPALRYAQWQYLIDKWQGEPGFEKIVPRLRKKQNKRKA